MPYLGTQPSRGLVGTAGIDADAITSAKIADDQIDSEHYAAGSIDTAHIAANQIDGTLTKDALIADYSDVTITASDLIMYGDATDSNNTKRDTVQGVLDLGGPTLGTATASTSGSAVSFTSIPSGIKRLVFTMHVISASSNGGLNMTIGDSGGLETSGYNGSNLGQNNNANQYNDDIGSNIHLINDSSYFVAAATYSGQVIFNCIDTSNNIWAFTGFIAEADHSGTDTDLVSYVIGSKALSGTLDRVSLNCSAGTFDAGTVNILYD